MCDPVTMLAAVAAGGKLFEGAAGFASHSMASKQAGDNADLLHIQSDIAKGNADTATIRGNYDEFLSRRKVDKVLGAETVHFASGNVDPTYGSPLLIQGFSAAQGETDAQLIRARMMGERADALTQAANIQGQAAGQRAKSSSETAAATTSLISGVLGAGTAYLTASSKWPGLSGSPGAPSGNSFSLHMPTDI